MDQLENSLKKAIETNFQAKLVSMSCVEEYDKGISLSPTPCYYLITLEMKASKHEFSQGESPSYTLQQATTNGFFDLALEGAGRLMSYTHTHTKVGKASNTVLQFITHDPMGLCSAMENVSWRIYEKEFDALMTKELSEN